jgi:hypothetical protein
VRILNKLRHNLAFITLCLSKKTRIEMKNCTFKEKYKKIGYLPLFIVNSGVPNESAGIFQQAIGAIRNITFR